MDGIFRGTITVDGQFNGIANGTVIVPAGAHAEIGGIVSGTLLAEEGAQV